ncbi:GNAT family N-acetyltransferase [Vagococcus silagei]|uniref:N-acetyltransferase n=1 Tax=Vagococcus silagei TaxID=2508885 RepID=A0A4S3B941_9ENTE|nr:N-acetyltransferase [Vagococcus silagei]THB61515.1 N-acetyltransferase [Vagococcus silagei]
MNIREFLPSDKLAIEELIIDSFSGTEHGYQGEAELVCKIRKEPTFRDELELVCLNKQKVIRYGLLSECKIVNNSASYVGLALAPLAVHSEYQKQGIGTALISELEKRATTLGYNWIVILGSPAYYQRFGYSPAINFKINSPFEVPNEYFMIKKFSPNALKGVSGMVEYSDAFSE